MADSLSALAAAQAESTLGEIEMNPLPHPGGGGGRREKPCCKGYLNPARDREKVLLAPPCFFSLRAKTSAPRASFLLQRRPRPRSEGIICRGGAAGRRTRATV